MSEVAKIILTALATIIGGVIVYTAGQLISKLVLDPMQDQRRVIGDTHVGLELWARDWANLSKWPDGRTEERDMAGKSFREYASRLVAATNGIGRPFYSLARRLGAARPDDVRLAARDLIGLSNTLYSDDETDTITRSSTTSVSVPFVNVCACGPMPESGRSNEGAIG